MSMKVVSVTGAAAGIGAAISRRRASDGIASACAWLVSDEDGYVTDQTIGANGGRYI